MKSIFFVVFTLFSGLIQSCNNKPKIKTTELILEESKDIIEPPPPSFSCTNSIALQDWFFSFCNTEKPAKDSITYNFGFFETDNCYAIYLAATQELNPGNGISEAKSSSDTAMKYYPLSKKEYKDLKWEAALNKIKSQLKEFITTKTFENSSLAKAKVITFIFDDGDSIKIK